MKEALIKLYGKADGDDENIIDFTSIGKVKVDKDSIYIEYDESEMSGMEGSISKIIISNDTVTLNRMGLFSNIMSFIQGQETPAEITTPYGQMNLKIFTDKMIIDITDTLIKLELSYAFTVGNQRVDNFLSLNCQIR